MLNSVSHINGSTINARDGEIGTVKEVYFDDEAWAIRYFIVDAGTWLSERKVLVSPYAVIQPLGAENTIAVTLSREQVKNSPAIDTHLPVSRRHEREYLRYYAYPDYWGGEGLWAMGGFPMISSLPEISAAEAEAAAREDAKEVPPEDVHLRSSANVGGYDIVATDGSIGHVKDFIFDDESWAIRYLVVDTRNWWPGGKKVLIATQWIDKIDWGQSSVAIKLTREQIKNSPAYDEAAVISRDYEQRLHDAYGRQGYWD